MCLDRGVGRIRISAQHGVADARVGRVSVNVRRLQCDAELATDKVNLDGRYVARNLTATGCTNEFVVKGAPGKRKFGIVIVHCELRDFGSCPLKPLGRNILEALSGEAGGEPQQRRRNQQDVNRLINVQLADMCATLRPERHRPDYGQAVKRLANRTATDAILSGKLSLHQPLPGPIATFVQSADDRLDDLAARAAAVRVAGVSCASRGCPCRRRTRREPVV